MYTVFVRYLYRLSDSSCSDNENSKQRLKIVE